ncbi:MAG: hypothetical protein AAF512_12800, partial [Pseudomonadota bacterium]
MIVGSADPATLIDNPPTVPALSTEAITFSEVVCYQAILEMRSTARESVLPPSLHPTIPPALSIQIWDVGESPWGACRLAMTRISCRSGVRARGFTTAMITNSDAATQDLRDQLGFPARTGVIDIIRGYDRFESSVILDSTKILEVSGVDPEPMDLNDVQYTGTLNLAALPRGLRMLQEADSGLPMSTHPDTYMFLYLIHCSGLIR